MLYCISRDEYVAAFRDEFHKMLSNATAKGKREKMSNVFFM